MINSRLANPASVYTQSYAQYNLRPRLPSVFRSIISDNFGHTRDYLFRGQWVYDACLREDLMRQRNVNLSFSLISSKQLLHRMSLNTHNAKEYWSTNWTMNVTKSNQEVPLSISCFGYTSSLTIFQCWNVIITQQLHAVPVFNKSIFFLVNVPWLYIWTVNTFL